MPRLPRHIYQASGSMWPLALLAMLLVATTFDSVRPNIVECTSTMTSTNEQVTIASRSQSDIKFEFDNMSVVNSSQYQQNNDLNESLLSSLAQQANQQQNRSLESSKPRNYFVKSLDSTRIKLVKFLHKIVPELSCYTNYGEHYRGKVSLSQDRRPCISWRLVRRAKGPQSQPANNKKDHNYCRNHNLDPNGPWCYVRYEPDLDSSARLSELTTATLTLAPSSSSTNETTSITVIQRPCLVSPCSKYLWIYIVAPPLGFLILLSCLITVLVRSARKSRYNSIFPSKGNRHSQTKLNRLISSAILCTKSISGRRFKGCDRKLKAGNYLDEDIFEIVDDIDWSEGQTQSHSPRSTTESLKLNSSFSSSSNEANNSSHSRTTQNLKATNNNPLMSDKTISQVNCGSSDQLGNRSAMQVGPMFATLRCHVRGSSHSKLGGPLGSPASNKVNNSTSTFIEQQLTSGSYKQNHTDWPAPANKNTSKPLNSSANNKQAIQQLKQANNQPIGGHLISCSNTTEDIESLSVDCVDNFDSSIRACDLPKLSISNISIALIEQPIYEGKFSQVLFAYIRHETSEFNDISAGLIGTQVAICSIKQSTAIDQTIFKPSLMKLRNLNHLNLLKLIGYVYLEGEDGEIGRKGNGGLVHKSNKSCSLVYDMAQLVDLSDWIKQQNKDSVTSDRPGCDLGIRRNLACFAKQVALAIDYLHDQDIVYKDLACRNCFLNPTKMLIKLATFNHELVLQGGTDCKVQSLKSMIRPKYLLDYYVIDSRPSDSQLLPLSWIPLESILFNKFNKQTDVWSFGCLLYELFSLGEVAYFGYSSRQVIDAVRANQMPPRPLLCPSGIYKLMCKCLSDIPTNRPNIKQIYEQLNLYSGQCSSFLDHHLCSLAMDMYEDKSPSSTNKPNETSRVPAPRVNNSNSITKTKSYANINNNCTQFNQPDDQRSNVAHENLIIWNPNGSGQKAEVSKIPSSKSINLGGNRLVSFGRQKSSLACELNHYDEPILDGNSQNIEI